MDESSEDCMAFDLQSAACGEQAFQKSRRGFALIKECINPVRVLKFSAVGPRCRVQPETIAESQRLPGGMFGCGAVFSFLAQDALSPGSGLAVDPNVLTKWLERVARSQGTCQGIRALVWCYIAPGV